MNNSGLMLSISLTMISSGMKVPLSWQSVPIMDDPQSTDETNTRSWSSLALGI